MFGAIRNGSVRLFRVFGIDVYLNWLWLLAAYYLVTTGLISRNNTALNIAGLLGLFTIVLMHEFGHALACRSVGGKADTIVLWPLGGVAYVDTPRRPGATLWTIAAGPLVNVALLPILYLAAHSPMAAHLGLSYNVQRFMAAMFNINLILLIFNIMPVYPLDGGQILMSCLWFVVGEANALRIAAIIGIIGAAGFLFWAINNHHSWSIFMAVFLMFTAWQGFRISGAMKTMQKIPRRQGLSCPKCKAHPPLGPCWTCAHCQQPVDLFENHGRCSHCGADLSQATIPCIDCRTQTRVADWYTVATVDPIEAKP